MKKELINAESQGTASGRVFRMGLKTGMLTAVLCFGVAGQVNAALLAYEGFDYAAGENLQGQRGGTGWSGAWNTSTNDRFKIQAEGLSYLNLATTGGAVFNETTASVRADRLFANAPTSGSVFFSFLVAGDADTFGRYGALLQPADGSAGPGAVGQASTKSLNGKDGFSFRPQQPNVGGINNANPGGVSINGTNLLVVKYNYDTNLASYWANPTSLGGSAPAATMADIPFSDPSKLIDRLVFGSSDTAATSAIFDEFRIGTSYDSVTPVDIPEPAAYAMIFGFMALLTLVARRRCHQ